MSSRTWVYAGVDADASPVSYTLPLKSAPSPDHLPVSVGGAWCVSLPFTQKQLLPGEPPSPSVWQRALMRGRRRRKILISTSHLSCTRQAAARPRTDVSVLTTQASTDSGLSSLQTQKQPGSPASRLGTVLHPVDPLLQPAPSLPALKSRQTQTGPLGTCSSVSSGHKLLGLPGV